MTINVHLAQLEEQDLNLAGDLPPTEQRASIGCNIKWKAGQEPDYFSA